MLKKMMPGKLAFLWVNMTGTIRSGVWISFPVVASRKTLSFSMRVELQMIVVLRTAIVMVLSLSPFGLLLLGPDCSSWTLISRGSSWRSILNPWGDLSRQWIRHANCMISRILNCTGLLVNDDSTAGT